MFYKRAVKKSNLRYRIGLQSLIQQKHVFKQPDCTPCNICLDQVSKVSKAIIFRSLGMLGNLRWGDKDKFCQDVKSKNWAANWSCQPCGLWHLPGFITLQLLRPRSAAPENEHNTTLTSVSQSTIIIRYFHPSRTCIRFYFSIFAALPVSPRATVMTNDVLLSIAEPSAESSIPTCVVLHFWIISFKWL